jgi:oxidoreductase
MDQLESDPQVAAALSSGIDSVFCALGTTRAAAGSASSFKQVDFEYVAAAARAAKAADIPHFSLVSAQGANPRVWASDFKAFHGLLYAHTKGAAEEAVKGQNFAYTTIIRPGLLDRGDKARSLEKFIANIVPNVSVERVAMVMQADAEMCHAGRAEHREGVRIWSMKDIKDYGQGM